MGKLDTYREAYRKSQQSITVWAKITLVFVGLDHFYKKSKEYNVEVIEVEKLGGIFARRYRVKLKGKKRDLERLSEY